MKICLHITLFLVILQYNATDFLSKWGIDISQISGNNKIAISLYGMIFRIVKIELEV